MFRTVSFAMAELTTAAPLSGIILILMVLFSGFILPANQISNGWIWFYWLNPISYTLKAVTVNQYKSSRYDFLVCLNDDCTITKRYGDLILDSYGNPTDERWYNLDFIILTF
jgi:hypothetical protein